jgi:hypothetical protein
MLFPPFFKPFFLFSNLAFFANFVPPFLNFVPTAKEQSAFFPLFSTLRAYRLTLWAYSFRGGTNRLHLRSFGPSVLRLEKTAVRQPQKRLGTTGEATE